MNAVQDHQMFDFGVLRELRKREDLTIEDVSSRSGVSAAVISKLERNQTRAELETLFRLSRVFGLNAADLLNLAESQTSHRTHSDDYESGAFQFRRIVYANFTCFHGKAKKGATVSRPEIHQDDNELCWVLEGSVRIRLPHEQHELGAGEAIRCHPGTHVPGDQGLCFDHRAFTETEKVLNDFKFLIFDWVLQHEN